MNKKTRDGNYYMNFEWGSKRKGLKIFGVSYSVINPARVGNGKGHCWTPGCGLV